jgi:hypothetical protein
MVFSPFGGIHIRGPATGRPFAAGSPAASCCYPSPPPPPDRDVRIGGRADASGVRGGFAVLRGQPAACSRRDHSPRRTNALRAVVVAPFLRMEEASVSRRWMKLFRPMSRSSSGIPPFRRLEDPHRSLTGRSCSVNDCQKAFPGARGRRPGETLAGTGKVSLQGPSAKGWKQG